MARARVRKGLSGVDVVVRNLNREIKKLGRTSMTGLIKFAIFVRRDMDKVPPKIPVDLNNLRASSFIVTGTGKNVEPLPSFKGEDASKLSADHNSVVSNAKAIAAGKPLVIMGFSANYAAAQEADTQTKRKRQGAGGAFFESSLDRNTDKGLKIIAKEAKI